MNRREACVRGLVGVGAVLTGVSGVQVVARELAAPVLPPEFLADLAQRLDEQAQEGKAHEESDEGALFRFFRGPDGTITWRRSYL